MKKEDITKRVQNYTEALFETASSQDNLEVIRKDLESLRETFRQNDLQKQLNSPLLTENQKKETVEFLAKKLHLNKTTLNFLYILAENKNIDLILQIADMFEDMALEKEGFIKVLVETAQELTQTQQKKLQDGLEKKLKKDVILSYKLNENLLGGLILHYQSIQIDDSLKSKLSALEKLMKGLK